jgi:hypothetical protein
VGKRQSQSPHLRDARLVTADPPPRTDITVEPRAQAGPVVQRPLLIHSHQVNEPWGPVGARSEDSAELVDAIRSKPVATRR